MNLTYYGHACFSVAIKGKILLFDPFITPNDLANSIIDIDTIKADYILLSHGHVDHIADCVRIASQTGAKVICSWEIQAWLNKQGIDNTHPMNTGGKWNFWRFYCKMHGSPAFWRPARRQLWRKPTWFYYYKHGR